MAKNKTDYNEPRTDLVDFLPEPLRSDVNLSIFNNIFNRYLTKPETEKVAGYIGRGNQFAIKSRQIQEPTIHRQGFQLQPIPYAKIGSVEHMASWEDIQTELEHLGVDMDDFAEWGKTEKFNWVPPIDINKIINYTDYYWVDSSKSPPQYITVRNTCSTATARLNFWEGLIRQFGSTFDVLDILEADDVDTLPTYKINSFLSTPNTIIIENDATSYIEFGDFINVVDSTTNDNVYAVVAIPTYDGSTNLTTIIVNLPITPGSPAPNAKVTLRRYDKIVIGPNNVVATGNFTTLFVERFVFFLKDSANVKLDNSFLETNTSTYNPDTLETTIVLSEVTTDNTTGGLISLDEQLAFFAGDKSCQCDEIGGWDTTLWDDNPAEPLLWGDDEDAAGNPNPDGISDFTNLINRISNPTPPPFGVGAQDELWFDTLNDILYQFDTTLDWIIIWNNFTLILDQVNGLSSWDFTEECDTRPQIVGLQQWSSENRWLHKNDVQNFANAIRAELPIIEYDWDLELNEWTFTGYNWLYRVDNTLDFPETGTSQTPPIIEIEPLIWWETESNITSTTIIFDDRYGDMTEYFVEGKKIYVSNISDEVFFVDYSEYKAEPANFPYRTYVTLTARPNSTADLATGIPNKFSITPVTTIFGDVWKSYGTHWMMVSSDDVLPSPHQPINPFILLPVTSTVTDTDYNYTTSLYGERFLVTVVSTDEFIFSTSVPTISTRQLSRMVLFGFDDIRVYLSDLANTDFVREFGTYDEIGETVFDVVDIDYVTDEFILSGNDPELNGRDLSTYFSPGDVILLSDNTGIIPTQYTIDSFSNNNRIKVTTSINILVSIDGNISNVTTPVPADDFVNSKNATVYLTGIRFHTPQENGVSVNIVIGPSTINEIGNSIRRVRTTLDNDIYNTQGDVAVSNINYRVVEQLKTETTQYPLFDIFDVEGNPTFEANPIFGYKTDSNEPINVQTQLRIVYDVEEDVYEFDQFLLKEDDGELFAYRDYANKQSDFWYNKEKEELKFWDNIDWSLKTQMSEFYRKAVVSDVEPELRLRSINGLYWYNPSIDKLFKRFNTSWLEIENVDMTLTDVNLQSIWKAGTNNELYIPSEVDWIRRSEEEYNDQRDSYISTRVAEIIASDPSISVPEATLQATQEWLQSQANHLSPTGIWMGDWETPDPLYYNNLHENRKCLSSRELLTHFTTIIEAQPTIPGYSGAQSGAYNLTPINDVNLALGGTIKEFNNGFDTFISSVFVDNITPPTLIEFAHDQYESLLNTIKELYRSNSVDILSNLEIENILNISDYASDVVIDIYELNDVASFVYGDSTTFTDVVGGTDLGVKNWIATLPYLKLVFKVLPERLIDDTINLNSVVHHDGHRESYSITDATADIISKTLVNLPDPRLPTSTLGEESTSSPANDVFQFINSFNTINSREGVYWYQTTLTENILYRYVVAASGVTMPSSPHPDGTLWMDTTPGLAVLRQRNTSDTGIVTWDVVEGLTVGDGRLHNGTDPLDVETATISAWQNTNLDILLGDIIFDLENRLYENAPSPNVLNYDVETTAQLRPAKYLQKLNEQFLDFVSQSGILDPYSNSEFDITDPFTWNYKKSAGGGVIDILETNNLRDSFTVQGDQRNVFDPCSAQGACPSTIIFYVKNSILNNGTWTTVTSTGIHPATNYDAGTNTTEIFVNSTVETDLFGVINFQKLPSPITSLQPNNLNDGSESGGEWRDLYEKFYNTPYPHLEPWLLQKYNSKPVWWDTQYKNDDVMQWGERTWKYKHGFEIVAATNTPYQFFNIMGDFNTTFISPNIITIDNSPANQGQYTIKKLDTILAEIPAPAGSGGFTVDNTTPIATYTHGMKISINTGTAIKKTYTIKNVNIIATIITIIVEEEVLVGDLTPGVDYINGALYTIATNETLIYTDEPITPTTTEGRISLSASSFGFGMWENIRVGKIPAGETYPNGIISITGIPTTDRNTHGLSIEDLPTFNYFSVNVDNVSVSSDGGTTSYNSDEVLPPFWDFTQLFTNTPPTLDGIIRSLYFDFSTEIITPAADYSFFDSGPIEWEWKSSSQFLYDQFVASYKIDPVNFIYDTFGFNFTEIGGLLIDRDVKNTPSHTRTKFHGDIVDNAEFKSDGLNQWYVNYNRFSGYDANFSDFQSLWTLWKAPLVYQFSSYIDTPSFNISQRFIDLASSDTNITSKKSPGVDDFWIDAFSVQIDTIPPNIARYNNQLEWRFNISTNIAKSRDIPHYDVHNYQFHADPSTDECKLYTWSIVDIDTFIGTFTIYGDQSSLFVEDIEFEILGSISNDGTYTVVTSSFDESENATTIEVAEHISSAINQGTISLNYRVLPWETGFGVYLSTSETLPIPLVGDTINGITKLFIIKTSDTTFKLANTEQDAYAGIAFDITTVGFGDQFVGEITNVFNVESSKFVIWRQYAIDKSNILTWNTPHKIQGMQPWIDIVRGYDSYKNDVGWKINEDSSLLDPVTNKPISWVLEIERFIEYAYATRERTTEISDRYGAVVDYNTDEWTFNETNNIFITGDAVVMTSSNGVYPNPLSRGITYYVIRTSMETFQLASSPLDAANDVPIDIILTPNVGDLAISIPVNGRSLVPSFEMNPFRNALWFNPPQGIVSNVVTGPVEDIRISQLIFDQNGNTVTHDQLRVYRSDKQTKFVVNDAINTVPRLTFVNPVYDLLHLGGMHLFIDTYEHVLIFDNYSAGGNLLYDPFIGLNVTKYETIFNRNPEFTGRPNVGGYYLETFFNQGASLKENFEAAVENLRYAYDTYDTLESNKMTKSSRDTLGYFGTEDYLNNINMSEKSQFIFWRGQIQTKGSLNAIKAYTNSRRFIDAKIDDFWAIKIAEFGSTKEKEYPEMFATTVDARSNEFKIEFINNDSDGSAVDLGFAPIKMADENRWYNQPDQVEVLRNNGKVMYFDMKIVKSASGADLTIITNGDEYIVHDMDVDFIEMTLADVELISGVDYEYINPYVVKLINATISPNLTDLIIWGYVVNNDAQNPSRLIDRKANTQLSPIEFWDPGRGNHYSNAIHNVDLQNYNDPAVYDVTPQTTTDTNIWTNDKVGTTWMDTSTMEYIPYNSNTVISDNIVRFRVWGQLYDFAGINIYEWVSSDVLPEDWDVLAAEESGDSTIIEADRKSGFAKWTLFEPDVIPGEWIPLKDKVDTQYASADGVIVTGSIRTFEPDLSILDNTKSLNVYINEVRSADIEPVGILPVTVDLTVNPQDVVKFVQPVPTNEDYINAEIEAGNLIREYEYVVIENIDALGTSTNTYYFWVGKKTTKYENKNRTMSPADAEVQLITIPSAHMFFQKIAPQEAVVEAGNLINRAEIDPTLLSSAPNIYELDFNIAPGTILNVDINNVDVSQNDLSYIADGTSNIVTVNTTILPTDEIEIIYVGLYDDSIILPNRYTQVIIRGLQGLVFDDNRYTIRFTRDFTLRDVLDVQDESIDNMELKNLHEEWKIFRQEQNTNIDRWQWDRITEAMIGYKLNNPTIRVPSLERELYDEKNATDTQYGLDTDQAFVNGELALSTILAYLVDPDVDFIPIDINSFFNEYNFDTPENIIIAMNRIYTTFKFIDVNRMYFSVLQDAFTTKSKYPGIFKTSMVALHGIKPLQISGVFDD